MALEVTQATVNGHTVEVIDLSQVERKNQAGNGCFICGKKVGKISYEVHMSVNLQLLPFGTGIDFGSESQGLFQIGSECRKGLPRKFVNRYQD